VACALAVVLEDSARGRHPPRRLRSPDIGSDRMIEARHLTKQFGPTAAVSDLSFVVHPGMVTGFLGPNGAGKTTTMRMVLGLDRPTSGSVTVDGKRYAELPAPLREVGALIDAGAVHKGRRAYNHLHFLARSNGIPKTRVDEVLGMVGLESVAHRRVKTFSLGMGQRLGIASALLGDPPVLLFDEPINGLDPEGILWVRTFMRTLAAQGRTVLVSSHLMNEMAQTAHRVIVIGRGQMIADSTVDELVNANSVQTVKVRTADPTRLAGLLTERGATVQVQPDGSLSVTGPDSKWVGELAASAGVVLHELTPIRASLEEAFMNLTQSSVQYHGSAAIGEDPGGAGTANATVGSPGAGSPGAGGPGTGGRS
jgi:ABC-2 type transport system ATP-binding protein